MKQGILSSRKPYEGIKLHMIEHFVDSIMMYGNTRYTDTIWYVVST